MGKFTDVRLGASLWPPLYKPTNVENLSPLISFQQITFKLGSFANLKALFSAELTDFSRLVHCQNLKKKGKGLLITGPAKNFFFCNLLTFAGGGGGALDQEIKKNPGKEL